MTETKHSPLPWETCEDTHDGQDLINIQDKEGKNIAIVTWDLRIDSDNAEFILKSANMHYELIDALVGLLCFLKVDAPPEETDPLWRASKDAVSKALNVLESASDGGLETLKKAKGE